MRRLENGHSAVPFRTAVKIAQVLDPEVGPEERAYFLGVLPTLAARECEPLSGPPLLLRQEKIEELSAALRGCLDVVEPLQISTSAEAGAALADGDLARKRVIRVEQLVDSFDGDSSELRRSAMNRWYTHLHRACRVRAGNRRLVWFLSPLPDGRTADSALRSMRGGRGRAVKRVAPVMWNRYLELQLREKGRSSESAYRVVSLEARRVGLLWEPSASTMRARMRELFLDFPELRFQAGKP
jgi:hypothetical protein